MSQFPAELYNIFFQMSLNHKVELPYAEALRYLEAIGSYNEFQFKRVKAMLYHLDMMLPRYTETEVNNPNFNNRQWKISVGREQSPVIYITFYAFDSKGIFKLEEMVSNKERFGEVAVGFGKCDEFSMKVESLGAGISIVEAKKLTIRMWWD